MYRVIEVEALSDYRLRVVFDNGVSGEVSMKDRLFGPVFEPMKDPAFFALVSVDEFGAVYWPNGADLAPDALYRRIVKAA
ncbi:DUF2442 domain-containing protein [Pistricoccus aurantiacus]|uniref:DUF2442 domain-containing protein n=1 Tax=Pistricoccus aurantiacus TaxID=1883414 RepID=A0A5B8SVD5_9GAMM|nr:DUF2442 domain-containing protein [Pistricoccus aurantiacus]QEA40077.1 DUF2442 domain-containing protein [Pistricoccus aurantiacus]